MPRIGSSGTGGANNGGGGSGNVTGTPPTTLDGIARWVDTSGTAIKDSPYSIVQDSGAIQAQGFIFNRQILHDTVVPAHFSVISSDVELISGDILLLGDSTMILI